MAHSGGGASGGGSSRGSYRGGDGAWNRHYHRYARSGASGASGGFGGLYYHSYEDRKGRVRRYYSSRPDINKPSKFGIIMFGIFMIPFLLFAFYVSINDAIQKPGKLDNTKPDTERVIDKLECFTSEDEAELSEILEEYYEQTGINAVVYTVPNGKWNGDYSSLQDYSMDRYQELFDDECHYLVVYSNDEVVDGWQNWAFETIVGDDTTTALGRLRERYMTGQLKSHMETMEYEPAGAIKQSFGELMEYSKTTQVDWNNVVVACVVVGIYFIVYFVMIHEYRKQSDEYKYAQDHPTSIKYSANYHLLCPQCKIPNTHLEEICTNCGTSLRKKQPVVNDQI